MCREWSGNKMLEGPSDPKYFDALRFTVLMEILFPTGPEDAELMAETWRTGRIPPSLLEEAETFLADNPDAIMKMLRLYIQHQPDPFPKDLFDALDMAGTVDLLRAEIAPALAELDLSFATDVSKEAAYYRKNLHPYLHSEV